MNTLKYWKAKLKSAYSFMLKYSKITVCPRCQYPLINYPGCFTGVYKSAWKLPNQTLLFTNCQNGCIYAVLDPFECLCLFCHFGLGNQTWNCKWVWRQPKKVCLWWPYRLDCIYQMLLFCYKGMFHKAIVKYLLKIISFLKDVCYKGMSQGAVQ